VSNLERGRGNPTVEALTALAGALDVGVGTLVGDAGASGNTELVLAEAPRSLITFTKSKLFTDKVDRLAKQQAEAPDELRRRLLVAMASAPRRSSGEPTEDDWKRLLDVYSLILGE
jgi:transcriptional regulator with XRE-family HTH domain